MNTGKAGGPKRQRRNVPALGKGDALEIVQSSFTIAQESGVVLEVAQDERGLRVLFVGVQLEQTEDGQKLTLRE
jgi:hypothetical protein